MSRVELGLLGVASYQAFCSKWVVRRGLDFSGRSLNGAGPVIRASWLRAEGWVVASGLLDLRLMGSVGLVPEVEELVQV